MAIDSKAKLTKYIKEMLGEPVIKVEVTDAQISNIIDSTIQKFTEYSYGTLEGTLLIQLSGMKEYKMPKAITNIIGLKTGSDSNLTGFGANFGEYVPNLWSDMYFTNSLTGDIVPNLMAISATQAMMDKYFGNDINYNFNPHKKVIQLLENYTGAALLYYQYEYQADDDYDMIFNHEWIKEYCIQKTKFLWGTITGKYSHVLVGGGQINYGDFKSEAQAELERLDEELLNKWSDPLMISVF